MNGNLTPGNLPAVPTEVISRMIENQAQEIALKEKELKLRKQQDDHSYEYAKTALSAQIQDNESHRNYLKSKRRNYFYFIIGLVIIISALVCYAMALNKDHIALEIIKAVIFFSTGGLGGYAIGKSAKKSNPESLPPQQP